MLYTGSRHFEWKHNSRLKHKRSEGCYCGITFLLSSWADLMNILSKKQGNREDKIFRNRSMLKNKDADNISSD
jgi:hypothetical protein